MEADHFKFALHKGMFQFTSMKRYMYSTAIQLSGYHDYLLLIIWDALRLTMNSRK